MIKLGELDFKTRLKIAWSLKNNEKSINYISIKYDINRKAVENIGLLYNQYGEPGLRDTSITSRPKPSDIEQPEQEMIITIILNHTHLTTNEVRNLLYEESKRIDPDPIQRFLTQAGLGTEELRNQYLEELRGMTDSKATLGIQKFAYNKIGEHDSNDQNKQVFKPDEHPYLLFDITLNPKVEASNKTAALHIFLNLCSLHVEIMVIDRDFVSSQRREFMGKFNRSSGKNNPPLFNELMLWHESLHTSTDQVINIYVEKRSDHIEDLNNSFSKWFGSQRIVVGEANKSFDRKIDFKVNFRPNLLETIMNSRKHNSHEGNQDQVALDYSIDRIQQFVSDHNTAIINGPDYPEGKQHVLLGERTVVKYSELLDDWVVRNEDLARRLHESPKETAADLMNEWRERDRS